MLTIGAPAPDFTLTDTALQPVRLQDLRGQKLVLFFFPLAFSGGCTQEMCTIRDDGSQYAALQATLLGISTDSPFVLRRFKEEYRLDFPLLSDFNKETTQAYGVAFTGDFAGMTGFPKWASFVLDEAGIVRYAHVAPSGEMPDFAGIREVLATL